MKSSSRLFARLLYASVGPLDLYILHDAYQLGPAEIVRLVRLFSRLGVINVLEDGHVELVEGGRTWLWKHRDRLFLDGQRPWARVDVEQRKPGEPYMPDLAKIDRAFFYAKVASKSGPAYDAN